MSSIIFLVSMGLVIYLLLQGDKQDRLDRQQSQNEQQRSENQSKPK